MAKQKKISAHPVPAAASAAAGLVNPGAPLPRLHLGLLLLILLFLGVLGARQVGSPDVGFHLKAGHDILSGRGWPRMDTFTYTINDHPYTDTTWGYQVLLSLAHAAGGAPGMVVFHLMILMGIFYLLYRTARLAPVDSASVALFLGAGILACEMRFEVRPEMLSYLFFAGLLYLLHRHAVGCRTPLWLLPLVLWLWANCHALFVLGWAALACAVAGLWLRDRKPDAALLRWSGAALLAPLLNPYGLKGVLFPFALMTRFQMNNAFAETIGEFASPFLLRTSAQYPFYAHWPIWTFRLLAVPALLTAALLLKRRNFWTAFLCLAFFPLEAKMIRNMPLMILTALPAMIWMLPVGGLWRILKMRERTARRAGGAVLMAVGVLVVVLGMRVVTGAYYVSTRRPDRFGWTWNRMALPVDAAEYVKRAGLPGPVFNHLNLGGYLIWALPQKVFIDGRLEVVGEEFYNSYRELFASPDNLEHAAVKYGFQWIILPYTTEPLLMQQISADPRWRLAYVDPLAVIFVREGPDAKRWVDRSTVERSAPAAPDLSALSGLGGPERASPLVRWLSGLIASPSYPLQEKNLGIFYYFRDEFARAEAWFRAGLKGRGERYYELYLDLGSTLFREKKYDEAAACYEVVLQDDPENPIALERLAGLAGARTVGR